MCLLLHQHPHSAIFFSSHLTLFTGFISCWSSFSLTTFFTTVIFSRPHDGQVPSGAGTDTDFLRSWKPTSFLIQCSAAMNFYAALTSYQLTAGHHIKDEYWILKNKMGRKLVAPCCLSLSRRQNTQWRTQRYQLTKTLVKPYNEWSY